MERPSHINFRSSHTVSSRMALLALAISLPLALLWALAHGTIGEVIKNFGPMVMVHVADPVKPRTPPPLPKLEKIVPLKVDMPDVVIAPEQRDSAVTATVQTPKVDVPPAAGPDRAVASIAATHTAPPYPPLAQRLGEQGNVVLRLTVLADGTVGKADVVTSSGSNALDESAQEWILSHWKYRPALDKGHPTTSHTVVTVNFNLKDQR